MAIPANLARAMFTNMLIDVYREYMAPSAYFQSYFQDVESFTRYVSIEVERSGEPVAIDVKRGGVGNLNSFSNSTWHNYEPPYFKEMFNITSIDLYDRAMGSTAIDEGVFAQFLDNARYKLILLTNKIKRAYEKMCSDALHDGAITLQNVDSVDYKRNALSLVPFSNDTNFGSTSVNPYNIIKNACTYIRTKGKSSTTVFNATLGDRAWDRFLENETVLKRNDLKNMSLDGIREPQRNATGGVLQGYVTAGPYKVNLWTYPEVYDILNDDGSIASSTPYMDTDSMIVLPEAPRFKMAYAAVPQVPKISDGMAEMGPLEKGAFVIFKAASEMNDALFYGVKSAGIPVLTAVDQVHTTKVSAADDES